jgi:hypothetical protein
MKNYMNRWVLLALKAIVILVWLGPTIRRTGIERRAGRPLPEPDVDALAISHYGRAVPVLHRSGVRGRMETVLLVRLGRELEQVI